MKMKTVKVCDLSGKALDWCVAKCEGATGFETDGITLGFTLNGETKVLAKGWAPSMSWHPSSNWSQGGPIIERERISIDWDLDCWNASVDGHPSYYSSRSPLIVALRCYVASKQGNVIEVPEDLLD